MRAKLKYVFKLRNLPVMEGIFAKKQSRLGTLRASEAQTAGLIEKWQ